MKRGERAELNAVGTKQRAKVCLLRAGVGRLVEISAESSSAELIKSERGAESVVKHIIGQEINARVRAGEHASCPNANWREERQHAAARCALSSSLVTRLLHLKFYLHPCLWHVHSNIYRRTQPTIHPPAFNRNFTCHRHKCALKVDARRNAHSRGAPSHDLW
jgi:hypothetical protein